MGATHQTAGGSTVAETDAHECLASIATAQTDDSALKPLRLLESTYDEPSGTDLVDRHDTGRATVYNRIDDLREYGFLWRTDDGFRMTRAGRMALAAYRAAQSELSDEGIAYLTGSHHRRGVLRTLVTTASTKADLAADDALPSRSTIHRIIGTYSDWGWVTETGDGNYRTTNEGRASLESYQVLAAEFEQLIDKSELLARLDHWAAPPVRALARTDLVTDTNDDPHALLNATVEAGNIRSEGLEHLRSVTPLFNPTLYDIFGQFVDRDTTFEIIYDQPTYQRLTQPRRIHYLAGAVAAPNVEVRIHPDPLYTGVGVYNHDTVMMCGSTRFEQQYGVVGGADELLDWANRTFDRLWAESESPSERFALWLKQAANPIK